MASSAFDFYRGTNHLFWSDFGEDKRLKEFGGTKTRTWIQGDLHSENFGSYHNYHHEVAYDINDFDESLISDYQYDIWRMAISLVLIVEANQLKSSTATDAIDAFSGAYLSAIADLVDNDQEMSIYFTHDNTYGGLQEFLVKVETKNSRLKMLEKWTKKQQRSIHFRLDHPNLSPVSEELRAQILAAMPAYSQTLNGNITYSKTHFRILDIAQRLNAGTGSLGTPRYYVLIAGRNAEDRRILDVKRQSKPSAYPYISSIEREHYDASFANDAERHAIAYRATTLHTDDYLGWMELPDGCYSVRERSPYKDTLNTSKLVKSKQLIQMCEQWGKILAMCHARADHNYDATLVPHCFESQVRKKTKGQRKAFKALVREVAIEYTDTVINDWKLFCSSL